MEEKMLTERSAVRSLVYGALYNYGNVLAQKDNRKDFTKICYILVTDPDPIDQMTHLWIIQYNHHEAEKVVTLELMHFHIPLANIINFMANDITPDQRNKLSHSVVSKTGEEANIASLIKRATDAFYEAIKTDMGYEAMNHQADGIQTVPDIHVYGVDDINVTDKYELTEDGMIIKVTNHD